MARREKGSAAFDKLDQRLSGLKAIDENLDLGGGISVSEVTTKLSSYDKELEEYNIMLKNLDVKLHKINDLEDEANSLSEKILIAVASKFGKDSDEYAMAGGTRKSDIKRKTAGKPSTKQN